ncbi:hypothetical protein L596_015140 [Steinernema carpocapsae]|nr:hypothetical protein L596_015140 [Steinernema carpocapsae]
MYLPMSPFAVDPNFTIYHSDDRLLHHHLNVVNLIEQVKNTRFPKSNDVTFVIHGFGESEKHWMHYAKDALVRLEQQTVILVYWGRGASHPNYFQASANTRVVGAIIAKVIQAINKVHGIPLGRFRLVGFSLGAHVAGFGGKQFNETKIGAIYGLDPAGPLFTEGNPNRFYKAVPPAERLDRYDADYVEILHTSGDDLFHAGAGSPFQWGDVDFYANGGEQQPGCEIEYLRFFTFDTELMVNEFWRTMKCSHIMAYHAFIHSITDNYLERHVAFECHTKHAWTYGRCSGGKIAEFGFKRYPPVADKKSEQRKFFFGTLQNGTKAVHVVVSMDSPEVQKIPRHWKIEIGNVTVSLVTQLTAISETLNFPSGNYTFVAAIAEEDLETVDGVEVEWNSGKFEFAAFGIQYPQRQWKQRFLQMYVEVYRRMEIYWRAMMS